MEIEYYANANDFLSQVTILLEKDEARYGLIWGIAKRLVENPHAYGKDDPWFCVVRGGRKILAAAMRTPPYNVLLAYFAGNPVSEAVALVDSISTLSETIPGTVGDIIIAEPFAEHWCGTHGIKVTGKMAERIYRLEKISNITRASGKFRPTTTDDKEILTKWIRSFYQDVFAAVNSDRPLEDVPLLVDTTKVYLWEDGIPVSMAAKTRPTEKGVSIGLVYTPPELRQKGYATSCVAALCKELLDSGYEFCMLYADLANPISNSIYQKIGFREVCDSVEYSFSLPEKRP